MATRRRFLQAAGLAGVLSTEHVARAAGAFDSLPGLSQTPNIIVLMTDQERYHTHWPAGWVEANLPAFARLQRHGLTFHRAYTAASECSASLAAMMTSQSAPVRSHLNE
jgi:choline-sulfatase